MGIKVCRIGFQVFNKWFKLAEAWFLIIYLKNQASAGLNH